MNISYATDPAAPRMMGNVVLLLIKQLCKRCVWTKLSSGWTCNYDLLTPWLFNARLEFKVNIFHNYNMCCRSSGKQSLVPLLLDHPSVFLYQRALELFHPFPALFLSFLLFPHPSLPQRVTPLFSEDTAWWIYSTLKLNDAFIHIHIPTHIKNIMSGITSKSIQITPKIRFCVKQRNTLYLFEYTEKAQFNSSRFQIALNEHQHYDNRSFMTY